MAELGKKPPLSEAQKKAIWDLINQPTEQELGDKPPEEVIRDSFNGDEDAYLRAMAEFLGIRLLDK
jgi:hypothetical protein